AAGRQAEKNEEDRVRKPVLRIIRFREVARRRDAIGTAHAYPRTIGHEQLRREIRLVGLLGIETARETASGNRGRVVIGKSLDLFPAESQAADDGRQRAAQPILRRAGRLRFERRFKEVVVRSSRSASMNASVFLPLRWLIRAIMWAVCFIASSP